MRRRGIFGYDIAQICRNGHVVNSSAQHYSQHNEAYCSKCGAETMQNCPSCQKPIRGAYHGGWINVNYKRPAHCSNCGHSYPWTEAAINAAREFASIELSQAEQNELADIIENLVRDTPATTVAASRMKTLLARVVPVVGEGFRKILVDVMAESAKKMIWP